jgi:hypothetical protein
MIPFVATRKPSGKQPSSPVLIVVCLSAKRIEKIIALTKKDGAQEDIKILQRRKPLPRKHTIPSSVQNPPSPPWHSNSHWGPKRPCLHEEGNADAPVPTASLKLEGTEFLIPSPHKTWLTRKDRSRSHVTVMRFPVLRSIMLPPLRLPSQGSACPRAMWPRPAEKTHPVSLASGAGGSSSAP